MKILLASDGSPHTRHMLEYLARTPALSSPSHVYTAITVVPPIAPHAASFIDHDTLEGYYREEAAKVLAVKQGWNLHTLQPVGHAAEMIARTATEGNYDMVVMGSHGHLAVGGLLLGSVTQRVLSHCRVAVLIVR